MKTGLLYIVLAIILQSCATMYISPVKNIPLLEKKGEGEIAAGLTTNSFCAMGSYAITKDIAVEVSGSATYSNLFKRNLLDIDDPFVHKYIEAGIGKINLIPQSSIIMEVFGGYGYGDAINSDAKFHQYAVIPQYKSHYHLGFMQFDIGKRWKYVEVGGALRAAISDIHFNYSDDFTNTKINARFNNLHIEPDIFVRAGKGKVRPVLKYGLGVSRWFSQPKEEIVRNEWFCVTFHWSIGVSFRF
jgi:hypothetical protein